LPRRGYGTEQHPADIANHEGNQNIFHYLGIHYTERNYKEFVGQNLGILFVVPGSLLCQGFIDVHLNSKEKLVHLKASNMMISKPYSTKQLGELGGAVCL